MSHHNPVNLGISSLFNFLHSLKNSPFARNVTVLATGTAMAQAIPVIASPVVTRLYSPAEFGLFALVIAVVSMLSAGVGGKYEVAMMLPKVSSHARHLLSLSLYFVVVVSFCLALLLFSSQAWILKIFNAPQLSGWILYAPLILLFTGFYKVFGYYANRVGNYGFLSKSKIIQSSVLVSFYIGFGLANFGASGLIYANLISLVVIVYVMGSRYKSDFDRLLFSGFKKKLSLMRRYSSYPVYNASTSLLNGLTASLPSFFLLSYYPASILGYFALVTRVISMPLSFISVSVSQVNLKKIVTIKNKGKPITSYLIKLTVILIAITIIPVFILVTFSADLFAIVFGENWRQAGDYAAIMAPALAIQFVASTLSSTLGATNSNKITAVFNVVIFTFTLLLFLWQSPKGNIIDLISSYSILIGVMYGALLLTMMVVARQVDRRSVNTST